jgi:hypothetical protein
MRFKDFLTKGETKSPLPVKKEWLEKAKKAIDRDDTIIYDVAENFGQQVDNIKHMKWFIREVAISLAEESHKSPYMDDLDEGLPNPITGTKNIIKKVSKIMIPNPKDVITKFLHNNYPSMDDVYEWRNDTTISVLIPDDADYLMAALEKLPFKRIKPTYNEKTKKITFERK